LRLAVVRVFQTRGIVRALSSVGKTVLPIWLGLAAVIATAGTLSGKVVGISDGDTVTVLDAELRQHRIRLAGIDAPEKRQPFGQRSKEHLSSVVFGREVVVEIGKTDRYGREVGKILTDGVDANLEQVRAGFAWHYKAYDREQSAFDRRLYAEAEDVARTSMLGLWRDANPVPPWEWRRLSRRSGAVH
jgi:endonuclease YncB( thermonuclease family)